MKKILLSALLAAILTSFSPMKKDNTIYVLGCYTAKQKAQLLNNIASSFAQISFYEEYPTDNPSQYCFKIGIYVPE